MENTKSPSEAPIKKTGSRLNERAPRITLQHLDKLGHGLEKVGHLVGQTLDQRSVLDRITFETERLSHSEASSRRNSDDGGRSNKESLRADGTNSEPPTANVTNQNAWNDLASSTSTTRTELSLSDSAMDEASDPRRRSHESALPGTPMHARTMWKSTDSLAPESAFGTSLADIMESPANKSIPIETEDNKIHLREDIRSIHSDSSDERKPRGWRYVRNLTSAAGGLVNKTKDAAALPGTPLPSFQSKPEDQAPESPNKPDRKHSLPRNPKEKDESLGETNPEGLEPESLMFRDGRRRIDMVLAYEEEDYGVMTEAEAKKRDYRRTFHENLIKEGLELELENKCLSFDEKTWFLKIHIPWKTEMRLAEVIGMKLPTKRFISISVRAWSDEKQVERDKRWYSKWRRIWKQIYEYEHSRIEPEPSFYAATENKCVRREEQFLVKDRHTQFSPAQRSLLVMQILLRVRYDNTETKMGIRRLLNDGTYLGCFPLHEGRYDTDSADGTVTDRRLLYLEWARPSKWFKKQPLWLVRRYFGDKIGLYFCWLGFYTKMLYAPAIVGTLCFLYGLASMESGDNIPSQEICDLKGPGNTTLCPLCDKACKYQTLADSCLFAKLTYLFDNPATVFFAIFMSFWATTFLELWKRKQSVLRWEWDLGGVDYDEDPRPEFETSAKTFRTNPVTREKEPYLPVWQKTMRYIATSSAVLFMIAIVMGAVLGTIIYRISMVSVIYGGSGFFIQRHAKIFTAMTAALINLIIIMILTRIYAKVAVYLTNMENPRTQTEYEDSYTFKIFFFEFMNFYSSLIYIAFFKGRFYDYPGDDQARKSEFFKLKGDICDPAGCLSELCIQLAIIMIGKQFFNNFLELGFPKFHNWWRRRSHRAVTRDPSKPHMAWEQDYHLQDPGRLALFDEYLEMILQYGFVTLFVAAFPLAPLFALLNNIAEIRLDAYKMVTQARRPLAERVEDIGAWYGILRGITYAAVVSNAFVIAYTSDFIPRMVYKYVYSPDNTLAGYIDHSLSLFNTSDYREDWGADENEVDPPVCAYRGYRNPPDHADPYGLSPHYWHVFAARLAFVVVFEHVVFGLTGLMQLFIPDLPSELRIQMQREALLAKEAKYEHGRRRLSTEYRQLITQKSESSGERPAGPWLRRTSRASDGLDAHVAVAQKPSSPQITH
uniref:Anoctamin n=1 Tax=Bombyx mori TaxID=7091 RepID=A0A8R2R7I0_BOMMO|nr:anoctamin-4 isoform X1 [Bombyx mori]XP_037875246.1 anoctamin-4 isoform X1 [Bombyx mori]XP_037875247.1 anoctamin-4 isoform X1 [Bombyx mori]